MTARPRRSARRIACAAGLAAALVSWEAAAQALVDPTRPPPAVLAAMAKGGAPAAAKAVPKGGVALEIPPPPVSLLMVSPTRRYAIVNGELISSAPSKGNRLVEVGPASVVAQTEQGKETIKLFPDVEKTPAKQKSADQASKKDKK